MTYSAAQNKASQKYRRENIKRIPLDLQIDEYQDFKAACDLNDEKVNTVLRKMIKEYTERARAK